jgi:hypothetical protein
MFSPIPTSIIIVFSHLVSPLVFRFSPNSPHLFP